MRYLWKSVQMHRGHISSVTCLDYSPTGLEIVSGSYDRTLRIFGQLKVCKLSVSTNLRISCRRQLSAIEI